MVLLRLALQDDSLVMRIEPMLGRSGMDMRAVHASTGSIDFSPSGVYRGFRLPPRMANAPRLAFQPDPSAHLRELRRPGLHAQHCIINCQAPAPMSHEAYPATSV